MDNLDICYDNSYDSRGQVDYSYEPPACLFAQGACQTPLMRTPYNCFDEHSRSENVPSVPPACLHSNLEQQHTYEYLSSKGRPEEDYLSAKGRVAEEPVGPVPFPWMRSARAHQYLSPLPGALFAIRNF